MTSPLQHLWMGLQQIRLLQLPPHSLSILQKRQGLQMGMSLSNRTCAWQQQHILRS